MRVSSIARWAECEAYALRTATEAEPSRLNVAAYVGTYAHALLAGATREEIEENHPTPLIFDRTTLSAAQARIQAKMIAQTAREVLDREGWQIIEQEQAVFDEEQIGHLDLLAWKEESGDAIIDLKTGQMVAAGWLQVGGYIKLSVGPGERWPTASYGGILHVPRRKDNRWPTGTLTLRPATQLVDEWYAWDRRISEVQAGGIPTRSPGVHCARCPLTSCAVRPA